MNEKFPPEEIVRIQHIIANAQIKQKLGASGLGAVYEIEHPQYGTCALKVLDGRIQ